MTPAKFIAKWKAAELSERASAQAHFMDLCAMLGVKPPYEDDQTDADYAFEKGTQKTGGGNGWADVWKRDCFGWEYKRKGRDLDAALDQLKRYALALDNPPLLIVSDIDRIRIHTNWTSTVSKTIEIKLDDLADVEKRDLLKAAFSTKTVGQLKPGETRQTLTEEAAKKFAELAQRLRDRKHEAHDVAHFIQRLVFCMFAEDVKLLPNNMFLRTLQAVKDGSGDWETLSKSLFKAMKSGGHLGLEKVAHFNGGLFEDARTLPLTIPDVKLLIDVADKYWGDIDPTIFGTLFERGLDPGKRSQLGAHYTDPDKIMRIVEPVVIRPLKAEWGKIRTQIEAEMMRAHEQDRKKTAAGKGDATKAIKRAKDFYRGYLKRLRDFRVLDPACGSGNFLYLSLHALMDLEHRAGIDVEQMGMQRELPGVGPENLKGIEINPFAAELARVTIWIGWLQWMRRNGLMSLPEPILSVLDQIENRDALLSSDNTEARWPISDAIVGNPPFLGGKRMREVLGDGYVERLFAVYENRVPAESDLVCYWVRKAWEKVQSAKTERAGLVTTNSIRGGTNRDVLDQITSVGRIFDAWGDEEWIKASRTSNGNHAAVRVSLLCFERRGESNSNLRLNGAVAREIRPDLTAGAVDLTKSLPLLENNNRCFQGIKFGGPFDISREVVARLANEPTNPNRRRNADVLRPWFNGMDITRRFDCSWAIDFGSDLSEADAALYGAPYKYLKDAFAAENEKRAHNDERPLRHGEQATAERWWTHQRARPEVRVAVRDLRRYIATPEVAKHRLFAFIEAATIPTGSVYVIAREDNASFGILHSRFHEAWALRMGTSLEDRPRYTPTTTFETFPFPDRLTPNIPAAQYANDPRAKAIAKAAADLNDKREAWLNPPELVKRVPEVVAGYPDRLLPVDDKAAEILKKRTLTNLYNERPTWLANLHDALDRAVARAYGWPEDISTDEALEKLFALNQERAKVGR